MMDQDDDDPTNRLAWLRAAVLGADDGIVSTDGWRRSVKCFPAGGADRRPRRPGCGRRIHGGR